MTKEDKKKVARLKKAEKYSAAAAASQVTAVTPSLLPTPSIPPLDTHVDVHVVSSSSSSLGITQSELVVLLILYSIDYLCIPSDDGY